MSTARLQENMSDYEAIEQDLSDSLGLEDVKNTRNWASAIIEAEKSDFQFLLDFLEEVDAINLGKLEALEDEPDSLKRLEILSTMSVGGMMEIVRRKAEREGNHAYAYLVSRLEFYQKLIQGKATRRVTNRRWDSNLQKSVEVVDEEKINASDMTPEELRLGILREVLYAEMIGTPELAIYTIAKKQLKKKGQLVSNLPSVKGYVSGVMSGEIGRVYPVLREAYSSARRLLEAKKQNWSEEKLEHKAVMMAAKWFAEASSYNDPQRGPESPYYGEPREALIWARLGDKGVKAQLRGMRRKIEGVNLSGMSRFIGKSGSNPYTKRKGELERQIKRLEMGRVSEDEVYRLKAELSEVEGKYHRKASLARKALDLYFHEQNRQVRTDENGGIEDVFTCMDWINAVPIGLINWTYKAIYIKGVSPELAMGYARVRFFFPSEEPTKAAIEKMKSFSPQQFESLGRIAAVNHKRGIECGMDEMLVLSEKNSHAYEQVLNAGYQKDELVKHPWLIDENVAKISEKFPSDGKKKAQEAWCARHAFYSPAGWNQKRLGAIIFNRLESGIDSNIHDASFWLSDFDLPDEKNGVVYRDVSKELDFISSVFKVTDSELRRRIPKKRSKYSELFSSQAAEMIYECVLALSKQGEFLPEALKTAVLENLSHYKTDSRKARSLKVPLENFEEEVGNHLNTVLEKISANGDGKNFPHLIGELRQISDGRTAYIDTAQKWLSTHGTAPHSLLTMAWTNRDLALKDGCADNPRAIKQWADLNSLRAAYSEMKSIGVLPYNIEEGDIQKYSEWLSEMVRCYDGGTAIKTLSRLKEKFNPECKITPMKIDLGDGWEGEILRKDDPRGLTIGYDTGCCMTIGGVSEDCIEAGYKNSSYGFFVLYKDGQLAAQSLLYVNENEDAKVLVADNIEANQGRDMGKVLGKYKTFFKRYMATLLRQNPDFQMRQLNIGEGYTSVGLNHLDTVRSVSTPLDIYTDAGSQRKLLELDGVEVERLRRFKTELAHPSDWFELRESILRIEREAFGEKGFPEHLLGSMFRNPNSIAIVLKDGDEVVGYTLATSKGKKTLSIDSTALLKRYQGKGLVADLMRRLDDEALEQGYEEYERFVRMDNGYAEKVKRNYEIISKGQPREIMYGKQQDLSMKIPDHRLPASMVPGEVSPIRFNQLDAYDLDTVVDLEEQIYPPELQVGYDGFYENLEEVGGSQNASFIIMENNGGDPTPIGYCIAYVERSEQYGDKVLYINDMAFLPEKQGRGYGKNALMKLISYAEKHAAPIEFHARENTSYQAIKHSEAFLEKQGYKIVHDELMMDYFEDAEGGDRNVHLIRLEKRISSERAA